MIGRVRSIRVWINAFIPAHVPGYSVAVPGDEYAGATMIADASDPARGYLTDQRSFSPATSAQSQMHSAVRVDVSGTRPKIDQWHTCQPAAAFPAQTDGGEPAAVEESPSGPVDGDPERMRFTLLPPRSLIRDIATLRLLPPPSHGPARVGVEPIYVRIDASAPMPHTQLARRFGDIRCSGVVAIDVEAGTVTFNGTLGGFPAFEMYAAADDGTPVAVFRSSPPRESPAWAIAPDGADIANRPIAGRAMRGAANLR
jgi:hypothetical protein